MSNKIKNGKYITDKNFYENSRYSIKPEQNLKSYKFNEGIIFHNEDINFNIDEEEKIININQIDNEARFIIHSADLENFKITFNGSNKILNSNNSKPRITKENMTGCLNIINSKLKNTKIEAADTICEDAINIINSNGHISLIKIQNTLFDGLDADFSEIEFDKIIINNSKNDCLDLSYGAYVIKEINTSNCYDKSISLGENSKLELMQFKNKNSTVGLAVKDSSIANVQSISSIDTLNCILAYRKKQEFSGSKVFVKNNFCDNNNILNDIQSEIIFLK